MSARVPGPALRAGATITIAGDGGCAVVRYLDHDPWGVLLWLETPGDPDFLRLVWFGNGDLIEVVAEPGERAARTARAVRYDPAICDGMEQAATDDLARSGRALAVIRESLAARPAAQSRAVA